MRYILFPFRLIYITYAALTFVLLMLVLFPFFLIASTMGRIRGGNAIYKICSLWSDIWLFLIFVRVKKIVESPVEKNKPYIFISNHNSLFNAVMIVQAFRQPVRPLGKKEMTNIPIFGFVYGRTVVTVDRSDATNRAKSVRTLKAILRKNISVIVFPEGTFNMTTEPLKEFYDGAFRIAIETQTPLKPVLYLDDYKRMKHGNVFTINPGIARILYMEEIDVRGLTLKDVPALKQKVHALMSSKIREYGAAWIKRP